MFNLLRRNPLDTQLKACARRGAKTVLITWNRGLGDIPLGLYALTVRIREFLPEAEITFLTRSDLKPGFDLLEGVQVRACPQWKRGTPFDLGSTLLELGLERSSFDLVLENPDPTRWLRWQLGSLVPKLKWNPEWDLLWKRFGLEEGTYVGVHVQTETIYAYEKNWPVERWQELFERLTQEKNLRVLLFGFGKAPAFSLENVIDLRGETDLFEMLSIIKNRCSFLVVPDSGVLSITYYLDVSFPIKIVSLWEDPRQGVLKQNVASPNPQLVHVPLLNMAQIPVGTVFDEVL
jgi:ADP-heptose:LPS heptosyltransferase